MEFLKIWIIDHGSANFDNGKYPPYAFHGFICFNMNSFITSFIPTNPIPRHNVLKAYILLCLDDNMTRMIIDLFAAGTETTSTTLRSVAYFFAVTMLFPFIFCIRFFCPKRDVRILLKDTNWFMVIIAMVRIVDDFHSSLEYQLLVKPSL